MLGQFFGLDLIAGQVLIATFGGGMKMDDLSAHSDRCANCSCSLEIAAVKFSFFNHPAMVFVCPNCGVTRADPPKRINVRDWVGGLRQKDTFVARPEPRSSRGKSVTPPVKGWASNTARPQK
jgi:hypothetical protein